MAPVLYLSVMESISRQNGPKCGSIAVGPLRNRYHIRPENKIEKRVRELSRE